MTTYVKSYGISQHYLFEKENNQKPKKFYQKINWKGDYDGNKAHLDININKNGQKEDVKMVLDKKDLMKIFNIPEVPIPIDQRLQKDFVIKNHSNILRNKQSITKKINKNHSNKSRKMKKFLSLKTGK